VELDHAYFRLWAERELRSLYRISNPLYHNRRYGGSKLPFGKQLVRLYLQNLYSARNCSEAYWIYLARPNKAINFIRP